MVTAKQTPQALLDEAIARHNPSHIFSCLSGGHDSLTVTHFAAQYLKDRLDAVVHINTGIGIEETREFVRDTCNNFGWRLLEYKATENTKADGTPDPMIYRDLVLKHGFPGPYGHGLMYARLKERQLKRLIRDHKQKGRKILLVSGIRQEESSRRMRLKEPISEQGSFYWVNPFFFQDELFVDRYMKEHALPRNPVKDTFCMSGECLCGAFAHKGELEELEFHYPETARVIRDLEKEVRAAGFPWGWEEQVPNWWSARQSAKKAGQVDAFEQETEDEIRMMCTTCEIEYEKAKECI